MAAPIEIRRDNRAFFCGASGSGKSTIARVLAEHIPYMVIIDPKWEWPIGPLTSIITSNPRHMLTWPGPTQIIYRPDTDAQDAGLPEFWDVVWHIGNVIVLSDELVTLTGPTVAPKGMRRAVQMGRSRGIGFWGITQRPAWIPKILMSEANHYFVGRLALRDDRARMAELMQSPEIVEEPITEDFEFYYAPASGRGLRTISAADLRKV